MAIPRVLHLLFLTHQQSIDFFCKHLERKGAGDRHGRFLFRWLSGRTYENKAGGSMKPPLVGFLSVLENRLGKPPIAHASFKR